MHGVKKCAASTVNTYLEEEGGDYRRDNDVCYKMDLRGEALHTSNRIFRAAKCRGIPDRCRNMQSYHASRHYVRM
jgi:hypothetical protein